MISFVSTARHDAMLRYAWGGVGWGVISFVSTARHDVMLRYAWGGVGWGVISFVPKSKANAMVCCSSTFEVNNGDGNTLDPTC